MTYSEPSGPELIIQHTGQVYPVMEGTITIGAAADNAMILADPQVSRHHAVISWQAETGTLAIQDLGSRGGTYVNERRILAPQQLRHGDVIRFGNTILHVQLEPARELLREVRPFGAQPSGVSARSPLLAGIVVVLLAGITMACIVLMAILLLGDSGRTPVVAIQSPAANAQIVTGDEIILRATASGASSITLLELSVDDTLIATTTSADPDGQSLVSISKPWIFAAPGVHKVSAVAYTAKGKTSKTAAIEVNAVPGIVEVTPTATPTPAPLQPTELPEPTLAPTPSPEPSATPATPATLQPTDTPEPSPTSTATPEPSRTLPPPPWIEYFQANPSSIASGGCTTLQWGRVSDAIAANIEPGIGAVSAPGSTTVCPLNTTKYTLTARGLGGTVATSAVVTVVDVLVDLTVGAIMFDPNPAIQGETNEVKITIQNAGAGPAGAFDWEWQAGSDARFSGEVPGLDAGATTVVTVRWKPAAAYASLDVLARVDPGDGIPESDETNNELQTSVQVLEAAGASRTVTLLGEAALDGYRSNDGRGRSKRGILVGNGELSAMVGEVVWRGFMSFDPSSLPSGATIEGVELRFYQVEIEGNPYGKLGGLVLDHVDYGSRLDDGAFATPFLDTAVLAQQASPGAWYIFSSPLFAEWLEKDLVAGRTHFQLRLRWEQETDGDGAEDYTGIESGDDYYATGNVPQLIVTYKP